MSDTLKEALEKVALNDMLEEYLAEQGFKVSVDMVIEKSPCGTLVERYDVTRLKGGRIRFCFSVVRDAEGRVGIWTRREIKRAYDMERNYHFLEDTFREWFYNTLLQDSAVQEALS